MMRAQVRAKEFGEGLGVGGGGRESPVLRPHCGGAAQPLPGVHTCQQMPSKSLKVEVPVHGRGHELIWESSAVDSKFCISVLVILAYFNVSKAISASNLPCVQ